MIPSAFTPRVECDDATLAVYCRKGVRVWVGPGHKIRRFVANALRVHAPKAAIRPKQRSGYGFSPARDTMFGLIYK